MRIQISGQHGLSTAAPTFPRPELPVTVSAAVNNLLDACSKFESLQTEEDYLAMGELCNRIGSETFKECSALCNKLSNAIKDCGYTTPKTPHSTGNPATLSTSKPVELAKEAGKNLPTLTSGFHLSRWKSNEIPQVLPSLPEVLDATLLKAAFIHQGAGNTSDLNYERLEWVGDSYMELAATLLISQTFPAYLPGKASQLRERLVKNTQLAEYARKYGFEKRATLPPELAGTKNSKHHSKESSLTKVFGDLFEAYIGAIVLSDPINGLPRAVQWLKDLWGMTIKKEIVQNEKEGNNYDSPLWRLRGDEIDLAGPQQLNSKDLLRQTLKAPGVVIEYLDAAPERKGKDKLQIFTVGVYLTGLGESKKLLAIGTGKGKKDAGFKAASEALQNKSMMKMYAEKKKVLEELVAREEAAKGGTDIASIEVQGGGGIKDSRT